MFPFKKILVAFQKEETDKPALDLALRVAGKSGGSITIAHVLPPLPEALPAGAGSVDRLSELMTQGAHDRIERVLESLPDSSIPITVQILSGSPASELVREVLRNRHELLVKASGPKGLIPEQLPGSVGMRLLRKCPCPVWIVKDEGTGPLGSILAAVDPVNSDQVEEELNHTVIQLGQTLADMDEADLHVLHAWEAWAENRLRNRMRSDAFGAYVVALKSQAAKALSDLLKPYGKALSRHHRHLVQGEPQDVVPDFVKEHGIDLVVMGTVARTGVSGFLIGNTAEMILGRVGCSILAIKPRGFKTSVALDGSE